MQSHVADSIRSLLSMSFARAFAWRPQHLSGEPVKQCSLPNLLRIYSCGLAVYGITSYRKIDWGKTLYGITRWKISKSLGLRTDGFGLSKNVAVFLMK